MKKMLILLNSLFAANAFAANGMIDVPSAYSVEETANRFEVILNKKGMTLFNRIKHSEGAKKVDIDLRNTQVIIFGNPKVGSPLMQCQQSIAIDLPQKALIWENAEGEVFISYNNPQYLKTRHKVKGCDEMFAKIEKALANLTNKAAN